MSEKSPAKTPAKCPYSQDPPNTPDNTQSPNSCRIVQNGFFFRSSDSKRVRRLYCRSCKRSFSLATSSECFKQKKRTINTRVWELLCSGVSQNRAAILLGIDRKTVVRKFVFMGEKCRRENAKTREELEATGEKLELTQFDELETYERSKCLPLSIPLVVAEGARKIMGVRVASMPAKGPLAEISRKKYGPREDHRKREAESLFCDLKGLIAENGTLTTDQNPKYPGWIKPHYPQIQHVTVKGRRGCVVGQGELKKIGFDPLFSLNHTAAMFRANVNRLFRRTWCTTKRPDRLLLHLEMYVQYHNTQLLK